MIKKKILILILFLISLSSISFAQYYENLGKIVGNAIIAEPIFKVESIPQIVISDFNKKTPNKEYYFVVKNYEVTEGSNKRITEVDFDFDIEIKNSDNNFPIKYELYDCSNGEEILNNLNKTERINVKKNIIFENKYKLVISWNTKEEMSSLDNIDILVNASQKNN